MRLFGTRWERVAERHLRSKGLTTVSRNFSCRHGEIDLVMRDRDNLVFVEVRYRSRIEWGSAAESVTISKQRKVIRTAQFYLQKTPQVKNSNCRFDVVSIDGEESNPRIEWFINAFGFE